MVRRLQLGGAISDALLKFLIEFVDLCLSPFAFSNVFKCAQYADMI
jgi:hypothetical protein